MKNQKIPHCRNSLESNRKIIETRGKIDSQIHIHDQGFESRSGKTKDYKIDIC